MSESPAERAARDGALAAGGAVFVHTVLITVVCLLATHAPRKHTVPFHVTDAPAPVAMLVVSAPVAPALVPRPAPPAAAPPKARPAPQPTPSGGGSLRLREAQRNKLLLEELAAVDGNSKLAALTATDVDRYDRLGDSGQGRLIGVAGPEGEAAGGLGMARTGTGTANIAAPGGALVGPGGGSGTRRIPVDPDAVQRAIQGVVHYPRMARQNRVEGRVVVRFRVDGTGQALQPSIVKSGGDILDAAALEAVERAAPFQSGPGWVQVPVEFSLLAAP